MERSAMTIEIGLSPSRIIGSFNRVTKERVGNLIKYLIRFKRSPIHSFFALEDDKNKGLTQNASTANHLEPRSPWAATIDNLQT
ncbi:hypothetical protein ZX61_20470 [Vibrio sp. VPAP30]|nr:hypothetical protein ZX61_20470 [Vibrio sp. VPAP30]